METVLSETKLHVLSERKLEELLDLSDTQRAIAETELVLAKGISDLSEVKAETAEEKLEVALAAAAEAESRARLAEARAEAAEKEAARAKSGEEAALAKLDALAGSPSRFQLAPEIPYDGNDSFAWFFSCFEDFAQLSGVSEKELKMVLFKAVHDGSELPGPGSKEFQEFQEFTFDEYKEALKEDAGIGERRWEAAEEVMEKVWSVLETLVPYQKLEHALDKLKTKVLKRLEKRIALEGNLSWEGNVKQAVEQVEGMEADVAKCAGQMFLMNEGRVKYKFKAMFRLLLIL